MSDAPLTDTLPGTIGRYEIRKELGRGTMGVVYEAHDPFLRRTIALKTIRLAFTASPGGREAFDKRFFAEARIAARLSHPGIVVVHDVGRDAETGTLFIALEHLQGRTLAEVLKEGIPIEWRESLHVTRRIAEALHHAHSQGVVHRDIKPANIMVLRSGEPKIMDFGIAKSETARIKLTAAGEFFGTPLYMSPEQALGRTLDARTDLFSLGAIAYSLLTGTLAFGADNLTRIIGRVVQEDPPPPSHVVRELPPAVDYVVARALAKDPANRYPDGKTWAEDIEDVLGARPPRHRSGWTAPRRAEGTLAPLEAEAKEPELELVLEEDELARFEPGPPVPDIEAQLATLVSAAPAESSIPTPVGPAARPESRPEPGSPSEGGAASGSPVARRLGWGGAATLIVVALVALAAAYWARRGERPAAPPLTAPSAVAPTSATAAAGSEAGPSPPAEEPRSKTAPARPSAPRVVPAQLAIDFEHSLETGSLRIWVDDELALDEKLESRVTKKMIGVKLRKGRLQRVLEVSPGRHDVRVRVAWDDNERSERTSGSFKTASTRRLEVRVGRLRKDLSLDWR